MMGQGLFVISDKNLYCGAASTGQRLLIFRLRQWFSSETSANFKTTAANLNWRWRCHNNLLLNRWAQQNPLFHLIYSQPISASPITQNYSLQVSFIVVHGLPL